MDATTIGTPSILAWPALGGLGAAAGTAVLTWLLWNSRDEPGARWFIAMLSVQFLLTASYTSGYFVFERTLREAIEIFFWISMIWISALFLVFALKYTGRGHLLRTIWHGTSIAIACSLTVLAVTNTLHGVLWTDFAVLPSVGVAGVEYSRNAGVFLILLYAAFTTGLAVALLVDTVISYGPLYRGEAIAVAVSTVPPATGVVLWALAIEPVAAINLTPVLFVPHVALDGYAFAASDMFEFHPATRRAGERAALADLGTPVVIIDTQGRIVNLNAAAEAMFAVEKQAVFGDPLSGLHDGDTIDPLAGDTGVSIWADGQKREIKPVSMPLRTNGGVHVGYTIVLQDVTEEREREQRLQVFNRILRHNLGNRLSVVRGYTGDIRDRTDDEMIQQHAEVVLDSMDELLGLAEKARRYATAFEHREIRTDNEVRAVLEGVVDDVRTEHAGEVSVSIPSDFVLETNWDLFEIVFLNLIENALRHNDAVSPRATVALVDIAEGLATFEVRDNGPGIPQLELDIIETGEESALHHGRGLGLWVIVWGISALGGDVRFDSDPNGGTIASIELPKVVEPPDPDLVI